MPKQRNLFRQFAEGLSNALKAVGNALRGGGEREPRGKGKGGEPRPKQPPPPRPKKTEKGHGGGEVISDPEERMIVRSGYELVRKRFDKVDSIERRKQHGTAESALNYALDITLPMEAIEISHDPDIEKKLRWFVIVYGSDPVFWPKH